MRTLLAFALLLTSTFAFGQRNFNGFTSDFRNYDGLPPNCYTPTVGNLNGHLAGINTQLCQLYALIGQIENDSTLVNEIQAQIDSILGIIQVIDIQSADTSVIVNQTGSTFDLSYLWGFTDGGSNCEYVVDSVELCEKSCIEIIIPNVDSLTSNLAFTFAIYAFNSETFELEGIIYESVSSVAISDLYNQIDTFSSTNIDIERSGDTIIVSNKNCVYDRLAILYSTDTEGGSGVLSPPFDSLSISGCDNKELFEIFFDGDVVGYFNELSIYQFQIFRDGEWIDINPINEEYSDTTPFTQWRIIDSDSLVVDSGVPIIDCGGNCIGSTNLDSILQYLINFYCQPEPDTCCSGGVFNNSYQVLSGIGIFDMSATFADTNCISVKQHTIIFDGDTLFNSFTPTVQYIGAGTWTTGDSIFVYSSIYVATKSNVPCDTVSQIDTIIVQSAEPPTVAVDDFVVIPRNACDTIPVTDNDVKPCGVASIAVLDSTSGISSVTIYNDSLLIICRSNFAFDTDTITYLLTSNCGNPTTDTGLVIVTANLQPQLPVTICYDGIDADNEEAQLTWSITAPSGYYIPTDGILWQSTDESGGFTGYSLDSTSPTNILYGSSGSIDLDSADIVIYITLINIFTQLPIFYEVNLKLADGSCDTMMLDTTASPSFMYAKNVQACFNYIGYQSGGTTLSISSGTLYRYSTTTVGLDSTIGLDSTYFLVDLTASPCSNDSLYQSSIKNVPPYTLVDVDGDPVSVTSGVSVTFGTSSINVNGGVAISILSPIATCSVIEFTQTWFFTWKGRTNTFTYAFDGVSFSGQCINLNGVILP